MAEIETCDYCLRAGDVLCYPGSGVFHEACLALAEVEAAGGAQVFSSTALSDYSFNLDRHSLNMLAYLSGDAAATYADEALDASLPPEAFWATEDEFFSF